MTLRVFSPVHVTPIPMPESARHLAADLAGVVVLPDAPDLPARNTMSSFSRSQPGSRPSVRLTSSSRVSAVRAMHASARSSDAMTYLAAV